MASSFLTDAGLVSETVGAKTSYRREFDEMENRIRKCERERAELEQRFAELMRERTDCERAAARAMKQRHKRQIEADRQRAERNESILRMLNKIDLQAASLAAKTDRLKMLKTQYEMYLMRTWSSAQHNGYQAPLPMIMAPPAAPKSEFVHYLSELTHQQTASLNMIPPPTALSSYLASQQKAMPMVPSFASTADDSLTRKYETSALTPNDISPVPSVGGTKAKRFEMSNEDFIRYIDSEVLKEPIPSVNVVAPSPELVKQNHGAYLEDVTVSEDEQRAPEKGPPETMDQFSIVENSAKALGEKVELSWADVADKNSSQVINKETIRQNSVSLKFSLFMRNFPKKLRLIQQNPALLSKFRKKMHSSSRIMVKLRDTLVDRCEEHNQLVPAMLPIEDHSIQQSRATNPHWSMARQAMKSRAFPVASSKPREPEVQLAAGLVYETDVETVDQEVDPNENVQQPGSAEQTVTNGDGDCNVVQSITTLEDQAVTAEQQEQVSSSADGYHRDENVMYQAPQYDATSYGNETQQAVTEAYQYQAVEGSYQEGQYVEGTATDQSMYQYQEGADQTNPYDTSGTYLDPNQQQYQYDENAQYYNQQQSYGEGQYYSENADQQAQQQQQQQYYVDNTGQQQQQQELYEGQEEQQQLATDQYTGEQQQMYYPSDGPDQANSQDAPATAEGEAPAGVTDAVEDPSRDQPEATKPADHSSLDTTAVSDPAKDPSVETKNTIPSSTNDQPPATDTPTVSSVNDESDFDFSTQ
ncbi:uncharacterized protein LOC131207387 [Anopheles bellator]|uniref:uncharacterized protein LOC131207387 n=1 Tax=Anopheles bellator TaxID=139047 RepID=UPI002648B4B2|nr:uncharacterized protein LOC131207387 [Anopheles bellator]